MVRISTYLDQGQDKPDHREYAGEHLALRRLISSLIYRFLSRSAAMLSVKLGLWSAADALEPPGYSSK